MTGSFRSFVVLAEMRTGSNLLEATLNAVKGVTCFGEAFNPYMMGWPDKEELLGVTRAEREAEPQFLLRKLTDRPGHLSGFRYFHDHDPRVFDAFMDDRSCAKIVLSRNPLDSYVSTRLAWETNQWKLNETETPIPAAITYDSAEFRQMLSMTEAFRLRVQQRLQLTGQSAFWLGYGDLRDTTIMTGLLHWLGRGDLERVEPARDQVPQNPRELAQKVGNFTEMETDLADLDPFSLHEIPNFEPHRGPAVPSFMMIEAGRGLIYMPMKGGPVDEVANWLRALGKIHQNPTQSTLKQWKRAHAGHRSFTVLRHPLIRAWDAFMQLLGPAPADLRQVLRDLHRVSLPPDERLFDLDEDRIAALFLDFLGFLRRNLNGQTSLPTHPNWASQSEVVAGFARFGSPDMLIREDRMTLDLAHLASSVGLVDAQLERLATGLPPALLHDKKLAEAARAAYLRDYIAFGFDEAL